MTKTKYFKIGCRNFKYKNNEMWVIDKKNYDPEWYKIEKVDMIRRSGSYFCKKQEYIVICPDPDFCKQYFKLVEVLGLRPKIINSIKKFSEKSYFSLGSGFIEFVKTGYLI